jgi:hypothetical protein
MTINYIPNDPLAQASLPMRQQPARSDRPSGRAGFNFEEHNPETQYDFGGTDFSLLAVP